MHARFVRLLTALALIGCAVTVAQGVAVRPAAAKPVCTDSAEVPIVGLTCVRWVEADTGQQLVCSQRDPETLQCLSLSDPHGAPPGYRCTVNNADGSCANWDLVTDEPDPNGTLLPPGRSQRVAAPQVTVTPVGAPAGYRSIGPTRVLDTRATARRLGAGAVTTIDLTSAFAGQPTAGGWTAASVNITAAEAAAPGFLTAWPCDRLRSETSVVNYGTGGAASTHAIVTLTTNSATFCVYSSQDADVIVDLFGGFAPELTRPAHLHPAIPARIYDSRPSAGPVASGTLTRIDLPAPLGVSGIVAAVVNLTAASPATSGYVTAYPCLSGLGDVSNLNFAAGEWAHANAAIVPIDASGDVCLYNSGDTELIVDLMAVFSTDGPGFDYQAAIPTRILDTRSGIGGWRGAPARDQILEFQVPGGGRMVVGTLTAVSPTADGYLTLWSRLGTSPRFSNLNFSPKTGTIPNLALAPLDGTSVALYNGQAGGQDLLFDLTGWFSGSSSPF